jgi:hypothetical protein
MYPVNQVILGSDPLMTDISDLDAQMQRLETYKKRLQQLKDKPVQNTIIWDQIDSIVNPMTEDQKSKLFNDEEYVDTYNRIQMLVQQELVNLVKHKVESSENGKFLLQRQLELVKKLKSKIISDTNREMEIFNKFKEYSKTNPGLTYDEFLKNNI